MRELAVGEDDFRDGVLLQQVVCAGGALQSGALTTTFTASQGLLLMIPTLLGVLPWPLVILSGALIATVVAVVMGAAVMLIV